MSLKKFDSAKKELTTMLNNSITTKKSSNANKITRLKLITNYQDNTSKNKFSSNGFKSVMDAGNFNILNNFI